MPLLSTKITPVHRRQHIPVSNPTEQFGRAFRQVLSESDFKAVAMLITQGHIEVVIDSRSRAIELIPDSQVEAFLTNVFDALLDDAAAEAALAS